MTMSDAQFVALAQLLRLRNGSAQQAARMVLVDGLRPSEAATRAQMSPAAVSNAVTRVEQGLDLARQAAGL